jgi:putative Ca2+/H+ antiporter (TMEM165/GDT1 family)
MHSLRRSKRSIFGIKIEMSLNVLLSATGLILLMEIGDKTMLTTMCLSAQYRKPWFVLMASLTALAASSIIAILLATLLATALPLSIIIYISGLLFIGLGVYSFLGLDNEEEQSCENRGTVFSMFTLILFSELGDKSQLAILALAVQSIFPIMVFLGAILGFIIVNAIGVVVGDKISSKLPMRGIRVSTGIIFIVFGILILFGVL